MIEVGALRILMTGGSGFIGTNLVEHFLHRGCEVLNLDVAAPRNSAQAAHWHCVDLLDSSGLRAAIAAFSPQIVLHMGARTDLDGRSVSDYAANVQGVSNIIQAIEDLPSLRRVVFASSRLVCRIGYQPTDEFDCCPTTAYGESKVLGEKLVRASAARIGCPWSIVRPTSIWGPWFDVPYKTFFLSVAKGQYVQPGRQSILKSFGFVGNTVHQLQGLIDAQPEAVSGHTFYLGDYPPLDLASMANAIQKSLGASPLRTVRPGVLRCAARAGDLLKALGWRNPPLTSFRLDNLLTPMVYDLESLRSVIGDLPYTMEQGVKITVDWLKAHGDIV